MRSSIAATATLAVLVAAQSPLLSLPAEAEDQAVVSAERMALNDDPQIQGLLNQVEQAVAAEQARGPSGETPVGTYRNVDGRVEVTRTDGTVVTVKNGDPVYQGDIVETYENTGTTAEFEDGSEFSVGADARMAMDEFVYDPGPDSPPGFNPLRSLLEFTSDLMGRDDPDTANMDVPAAGGIRG